MNVLLWLLAACSFIVTFNKPTLSACFVWVTVWCVVSIHFTDFTRDVGTLVLILLYDQKKVDRTSFSHVLEMESSPVVNNKGWTVG